MDRKRRFRASYMAVFFGVLWGVALGFASDAPPSASVVNSSFTVNISGSGTVASNPAGSIACPGKCTASLPTGSELTLTATPAAGSHFVGWEGEGGCSGAAPSCDVAVGDATVVNVTFQSGGPPPLPQVQPLSVTVAGDGFVTSDPEGAIDCGSICSTRFSGGGTVHLVANASPDSTFLAWAGACTGAGACDVPVTSAQDVEATFRPLSIPAGASLLTIVDLDPRPALLNEAILPDYGQVDYSYTDPEGNQQSASCTDSVCSTLVRNDTTVVLHGVGVGDGTRFAHWGGSCIGDADTCILVMGRPEAVVASFTTEPIVSANGLNVTRFGGGRVESTPPGIKCGAHSDCSAAYGSNVKVRLRPIEASGYTFRRWGDDCSGDGGCTVRMDASRSVTAAFRRIRDRVSVDRTGSGSGTVSSNPAGIACGADCASLFPRGSTVALTATQSADSQFTTWTGACSGTSSTCKLDLERAVNITAHFQACAAPRLGRGDISARFASRRKRVSVAFNLAGDVEAATVRLLRGTKSMATATFSRLRAGSHDFVLALNRRAPRGRYSVQLQVNDACGRTSTVSTRTFRL